MLDERHLAFFEILFLAAHDAVPLLRRAFRFSPAPLAPFPSSAPLMPRRLPGGAVRRRRALVAAAELIRTPARRDPASARPRDRSSARSPGSYRPSPPLRLACVLLQ